ncbi:uncharacterized protein LOC134247887 [Saccostrea cucullata]|uniref:uncharacterized protein LOC134247887 n=1 Tax=Saccostrea cuccullata TaxID=36930 RepID=UPI002ECFB1B5
MLASLSEVENLRTSVIPNLQSRLSNVQTGITDFQAGISKVQTEIKETAQKKITEILEKLDKDEQILKDIEKSELDSAQALQNEILQHLETAQSLVNSEDKMSAEGTNIDTEVKQKVDNLKSFQNSIRSSESICWSEDKESSIKRDLGILDKPFLQAQVSIPPQPIPQPTLGDVAVLKKLQISSSTNMDITQGQDGVIWISMNKFQVIQINEGEIGAQYFTRTVNDWMEINEMQGVAVNRAGHLLTTDKSRRTVSQFSPHRKTNMDLIRCGDWSPTGGICCSSDHKIFVSLLNNKRGKICVYTSSGELENSIEKSSTGKPIFSYPWYIAVNENKNICVSDKAKKSVLVVSQTGLLQATYRPTKGTFVPYGIATDKFNHILVADSDNSKIHILSEACEVQLLIQCKDLGLSKPRSLCVKSEGELWVGNGEKGIIQLLQYIQ